MSRVVMLLLLFNGVSIGGAASLDPTANSSWNIGGGNYTTVRIGTIAHIPGLTHGAPYTASIFYPTEALTSPERFPVVSFAHGTGTAGVSLTLGYGTDLTTLAAYGFIVVGFDSCPLLQCGAAFSTDQLAVLAAIKAHGATLHPSLANADTERTAVMGHSMGAMATLQSAVAVSATKYHIKAAVAQHCCIDPTAGQPGSAAEVGIPFLLTSGGADTICPYSYTSLIYADLPTDLKCVVSWNAATHYDPCGNGEYGKLLEVDSSARFLACAVRSEHCNGMPAFCKRAKADVCKAGFGELPSRLSLS